LQAETGKFKGAVVGRFGGNFEKYIKDRWNMVEEIPKGTTNAADIRDWDVKPPPEYFEELARVSKHQIIWGANYFEMPPTRCFVVWRKLNIPLDGFSMSPVEYAWTSFFENASMVELYSSGGAGRESRFHPTQKPVELYTWIFKKYAKSGMKILDTHLGSGSSRIAAYNANLDFWGYEIDKYYFDKQEERFAKCKSQQSLFIDTPEVWEQTTL
jgi:site-specific DNA-methyltransferase (adenine-specific)